MLRRSNPFARAILPAQDAGRYRLTKFAGELSGARHFNVPLYPIESHLAQFGSWPAKRRRRKYRVRRYRAPDRVHSVSDTLVEWLTPDGRYKVGTVTANDR
jgi:hypothetical protein